LEFFREQLQESGLDYEIFPVSAATNKGLQPLIYKVADMLDEMPDALSAEEVPEVEERKIYKYEKEEESAFTVRKDNDQFVVESPGIEKFIKRTNFSSYEG